MLTVIAVLLGLILIALVCGGEAVIYLVGIVLLLGAYAVVGAVIVMLVPEVIRNSKFLAETAFVIVSILGGFFVFFWLIRSVRTPIADNEVRPSSLSPEERKIQNTEANKQFFKVMIPFILGVVILWITHYGLKIAIPFWGVPVIEGSFTHFLIFVVSGMMALFGTGAILKVFRFG